MRSPARHRRQPRLLLPTPPRLFGPIAVSLGKAGLSVPDGDGFVRAVIEKPFGWDEVSAKDLYADLSSAFVEEQIFRIDHYLAKETVQNLLALRFANSIFEPIWNRTWVDNVQITVAETLGVGERGGFYETTGAMRDIVQNHVLQVLSLFLMEPPTSFHAGGDPRREGETAPRHPSARRGRLQVARLSGDGEHLLVCVANLSPVVREGWRVGLPAPWLPGARWLNT